MFLKEKDLEILKKNGRLSIETLAKMVNMSEIAYFVSNQLATLDSVISTTTHFIMKKYKHDGTIYEQDKSDKRIVVSP